ncbi:hypothetical protein [Actinokineospora cianjurensis]|uniref:Uncharacterized protein n=1 Tax=Actinokineospora cianjurensis TaxID=585224 RepID=A0A421AYB7_9PSEU|nr:hypothetical protein [Actinokineospora cianjurensis]RLK54862.1 hypothetical protein CLV68_5252 [Actinokineospora cianjurensis]
MLGSHLTDLVTAIVDDRSVPHTQFAPAARFRTRSPQGRVLRQARALGSGALATGVLVAVLAAVLRIWIK